MKFQYNIYMTNNYKIFKTIIDLVTIIILYILPLARFAGVINILMNIKSILIGTIGACSN